MDELFLLEASLVHVVTFKWELGSRHVKRRLELEGRGWISSAC